MIDRQNRGKALSEVKPVEKISKNLEFSRVKFGAKGSTSFT